MNKVIEVILNIITLGWFAWRKYKKHEPKVTALYVGINEIIKSDSPTPDKIIEILERTQESYGVLNEVGMDLTALYVKGVIKK